MTPSPTRLGILMVVSGPSGTGKTTLCRRLRDRRNCIYAVSCTTRPVRPGERDGIDYHFLAEADFDKRAASGEFLEHARVHEHRYGTLRTEVCSHLEQGRDVLIDIDTRGAALIRGIDEPLVRRCLVDVFVRPPSMAELGRRLGERATDDPGTIRLRLENAAAEIRRWSEYQYTLVSASRDDDYSRFEAILLAERQRSSRLIAPDGEGEASAAAPEAGTGS